MNIIQKINLQPLYGELILFKEGLFYNAYNESCYILTHLLKQPLKINFRKISALDNRIIALCGFPCSKLSERVPKTVPTDFGVKLEHQFDLQGYWDWFTYHYRLTK